MYRLHDRGAIEPGKRADLVLLNPGVDPLTNVSATRAIAKVQIGGWGGGEEGLRGKSGSEPLRRGGKTVDGVFVAQIDRRCDPERLMPLSLSLSPSLSSFFSTPLQHSNDRLNPIIHSFIHSFILDLQPTCYKVAMN